MTTLNQLREANDAEWEVVFKVSNKGKDGKPLNSKKFKVKAKDTVAAIKKAGSSAGVSAQAALAFPSSVKRV